jgi:hypothetical protein
VALLRGLLFNFFGEAMPQPQSHPDERIYTAIGKAASAWADLDETIFRLFTQLMQEPEDFCAIFFFPLHITGRLTLINNVYALRGEKTSAAYWKSLFSITKQLANERHFIVHSPVGFKLKGGGRAHIGQLTGYYEQLLRNKPFRTNQVEEIDAIASCFIALDAEWEAFRLHLSGERALPQKFHKAFDDQILSPFDQSHTNPPKQKAQHRSSRRAARRKKFPGA